MIYITDTIKIVRQNNQIVIKKGSIIENNTTKTIKWKSIGYYATLESALKAVVNRLLFDLVDESLKIDKLLNEIKILQNNFINCAEVIKQNRLAERKSLINEIRLDFVGKLDYKNFGIPIRTLDDYLEEKINEGIANE